MNRVNDLFADEICHKKYKRGKMWRKMLNAAIFLVMRAVIKTNDQFFSPNLSGKSHPTHPIDYTDAKNWKGPQNCYRKNASKPK